MVGVSAVPSGGVRGIRSSPTRRSLRTSPVPGTALSAVTFSFDDFIIAFFTRGRAQTLPIFLFSSIRRGVSPVVNATASSLLAFTVMLLVVASIVDRRRSTRPRRQP